MTAKKRKRGPYRMNPNSLKNLKMVKPGEVRNPKGPHNFHRDTIKAATMDDTFKVLSLFHEKGVDQIRLMLISKKSKKGDAPEIENGIQEILAKSLLHDYKTGKLVNFETILNRVIGRPHLSVTIDGNSQALPSIVIERFKEEMNGREPIETEGQVVEDGATADDSEREKEV